MFNIQNYRLIVKEGAVPDANGNVLQSIIGLLFQGRREDGAVRPGTVHRLPRELGPAGEWEAGGAARAEPPEGPGRVRRGAEEVPVRARQVRRQRPVLHSPASSRPAPALQISLPALEAGLLPIINIYLYIGNLISRQHFVNILFL